MSLLANGRVGASGPVPGDPESKVSQEYGPRVFNAIRIGARTVWLIGGGESRGISSFKPRLWACCTETGEARELTSPVIARTPMPTRHSSVSTQPGSSGSPGPTPREWSSSILRRLPCALRRASFPGGLRTSSLFYATSPAVSSNTTREPLPGSSRGRRASARARGSSVQRVAGPHTIVPALLAASYRAGGLTVGIFPSGLESQDECVPGPSRARRRARLPRSGCGLDRDCRGLIPPAPHNTGRNVVFLNGEAYGTFIPAGLVAVGLYQQTSRSLAVGAFVPLGRYARPGNRNRGAVRQRRAAPRPARWV